MRALQRSGWTDVVGQGGWYGVGERGDRRGIEAVKHWTHYGKPWHARAAAARTMARLGEEKRDVREHLLSLLDDPAVRMRLYLVEALEELQDRRAIPELQRLADR